MATGRPEPLTHHRRRVAADIIGNNCPIEQVSTYTAAPYRPPPTGRNETELERYDRNLVELMGELRVALPGVQVLFAFLLVVPFNQRFARASGFEQRLYFATLLLTALASILLIAPTMIHRLTFQHGQKPYLVRVSNRLAIAGMAVLSIAMTSAVGLVTHFLFGPATAIATVVLVLLAFAAIWFAVPLMRRRRA